MACAGEEAVINVNPESEDATNAKTIKWTKHFFLARRDLPVDRDKNLLNRTGTMGAFYEKPSAALPT
jgi:hypothetical protein